MDVHPQKPIETMTEEELRDWKRWLLAEGKQPGSISTPRSLAGSAFDYDARTHQVIEYASDSLSYAVGVQDGRIGRIEQESSEAFEQESSEALKSALTRHVGRAGMLIIESLVILAFIPVFQGLWYVTDHVTPPDWANVRFVLEIIQFIFFNLIFVGLVLDMLLIFAPGRRHVNMDEEPDKGTSPDERKAVSVPFVTSLLIRVLVGSRGRTLRSHSTTDQAG